MGWLSSDLRPPLPCGGQAGYWSDPCSLTGVSSSADALPTAPNDQPADGGVPKLKRFGRYGAGCLLRATFRSAARRPSSPRPAAAFQLAREHPEECACMAPAAISAAEPASIPSAL